MNNRKKRKDGSNHVSLPVPDIKIELINILKNLMPLCNDQPWLKREITVLENREDIPNSYFFLYGIATALWYQWEPTQAELFSENNTNTNSLREFINHCYNHVRMIRSKKPLQELIVQVIEEEREKANKNIANNITNNLIKKSIPHGSRK